MKTSSFSFIGGLLFAFLLCPSCKQWFGEPGTIVINFNSTLTRSLDVDVSDYLLKVSDAKGKTYYEGTYGASPEALSVPAGSYTVSAVSREFQEPAYDLPQLGDTQLVVVGEGETVGVLLTCAQLNSGLQLTVDESFAATFPQGELYLKSADGELLHSYEESRTAFFNPGNVSVVLDDGGVTQTLFARNLRARQMLQMELSAVCSETSGSIDIEVDTTRQWLSDSYVYGGEDDASYIENALDVTSARARGEADDVWVKGYIVGEASSSGKFVFEPPFGKGTNLVLGLRQGTTDPDYCLSVELKSGAVRDELNLVDNPALHKRFIYIKGDLVSSYYGIPGLKSITEYQLD